MEESRVQLSVVRYRKEPWLVKVFDPRPHAECDRTVDYLCPLYGNEGGLDKGRFHCHENDEEDFEFCTMVDFTDIDSEGERVLQLEIMLEWIARERTPWALRAENGPELQLLFWFADGFAASAFDLMFGGKPSRIEDRLFGETSN